MAETDASLTDLDFDFFAEAIHEAASEEYKASHPLYRVVVVQWADLPETERNRYREIASRVVSRFEKSAAFRRFFRLHREADICAARETLVREGWTPPEGVLSAGVTFTPKNITEDDGT